MSDSFSDKIASIGFVGIKPKLCGKPEISVVRKPGRGNSFGAIVVTTGDPIEKHDMTQMAQEKMIEHGKAATERSRTSYEYYSDGKESITERIT